LKPGFSAALAAIMVFLSLEAACSPGERGYAITPGDQIEIFVWDNPELSRQLEVKMDGSISLPLLGRIRAEGLTAAELEESVTLALEEYVRSPRVSVIISRHSRWMVAVFGEVAGRADRRAQFSYYGGMGILELVARAGGFSREARLSECVVLRESGGGMRERIEVDLKRILEGRDPDFLLQPGDVVYIPYTGLSAWNHFVRNVMPTLSFIASMVTISALLF